MFLTSYCPACYFVCKICLKLFSLIMSFLMPKVTIFFMMSLFQTFTLLLVYFCRHLFLLLMSPPQDGPARHLISSVFFNSSRAYYESAAAVTETFQTNLIFHIFITIGKSPGFCFLDFWELPTSSWLHSSCLSCWSTSSLHTSYTKTR